MVETLYNNLKESLPVWIEREIPPSQGTLPFTHVGCPQSNGGHYINNQSQKGFPKVETNKSTKEILEINQETCPYNFQIKVPSTFQSVYQVPSQLNSKEATQLKCQNNFQVPSQGIHQLICQI